MRRAIVFALACAGLLHAQIGRTTDWVAFGGDSERDGWEKNEQRFTKDDVKSFQLLWQRKLDNSKSGLGALLPPVVLGNLIGYRGFKELAFVAGSNNSVWSMDSDLDRLYWSKHLPVAKAKGKNCDGSLTAVPALPGPVVFRVSHPVTPAGTVGTNPSPAKAAAARSRGGFERFVHPHPVFLLTSDGLLHKLNQSDGSEMGQPIQFVPAGTPAQALNVMEDTVYTSTRAGCGQAAALWSIDTSDPAEKVKSFKLGTDVAGLGGVVLDGDGNAFVQTGSGTLNPAANQFGNALVAVNSGFTESHYFALPDADGKKIDPSTSPVVFKFKDHEVVVAAGSDGRLYVLNASAPGGEDHHQSIFKSVMVPAMDGVQGHGFWGGLSSWEDTDGSRYLLAPVWGPLSAELQAAVPGTDAPNGSIVAFKMEDKEGTATLTPAWVSRDLESPVPPVIAKGVVFALSSGQFSTVEKHMHGEMVTQENPKKGSHATLYALDGVTGKEMYSTGDKVAVAANLTGMSVANGRVYFVTVDNTVQVFGKYLEP